MTRFQRIVPKSTTISKFLSFVLRHEPEQIGLKLDKEGWMDIDELIDNSLKYRGIVLSLKIIDDIVEKDEKGRYQISPDRRRIRALQGHSNRRVGIEYKETIPPDILFHGTASKSISAIMDLGLLPMGRQYVQLSADEATAVEVGKRHGTPVVLRVEARNMHLSGDHKFLISENGVWLVKTVPVDYIYFHFKKVKGVFCLELNRDPSRPGLTIHSPTSRIRTPNKKADYV